MPRSPSSLSPPPFLLPLLPLPPPTPSPPTTPLSSSPSSAPTPSSGSNDHLAVEESELSKSRLFFLCSLIPLKPLSIFFPKHRTPMLPQTRAPRPPRTEPWWSGGSVEADHAGGRDGADPGPGDGAGGEGRRRWSHRQSVLGKKTPLLFFFLTEEGKEGVGWLRGRLMLGRLVAWQRKSAATGLSSPGGGGPNLANLAGSELDPTRPSSAIPLQT